MPEPLTMSPITSSLAALVGHAAFRGRRRAALAGARQLPRGRSRPLLPRAGRLHPGGEVGLRRLRGAGRVPRVRAAHGEKFGIWGGLSERERRRVRRQRALERRGRASA